MNYLRLALLCCVTIMAGCAPSAEPDRILTAPPRATAPTSAPTSTLRAAVPSTPAPETIRRGTSRCISPSDTPLLTVDVGRMVRSLNANTSAEIATLEYLLYQIDSNFTCGTLFQETVSGQVRSVRVYELTQGATQYSAAEEQLQSALRRLQLEDTSSVVIHADFDGLLPKTLLRAGWRSDGVETPGLRIERMKLYSGLATSNRSVFLSARSPRSTINDRFNCADFSTQAAAQAFFSGLPDDINRLDGDNDGIACESAANSSRPYQVALEDLPGPSPVTSSPTRRYTPSSNSSSSSSGKCYVSGYTRKDGTRVSGYYRSC